MMEDEIKALKAILDQRQTKIDEHDKEIAELRTQIAVLVIKQEALIQKLDGFSSGINRGLWIIGGGFIAAFVAWIVRGGLSGG